MPTKEQLIERYRDINVDSDHWYEPILDEFVEVLSCVGIPLDTKDVVFRLAYSQGDGAEFSARPHTLGEVVRAAQVWKLEKRKEYEDAEGVLHGVPAAADALATDMLDRYEAWLLSAELTKGLNYVEVAVRSSSYHGMSVDVDVELNSAVAVELDREFPWQWLTRLYKALAQALYDELREENEYQTADEQVWETIVANDLHTEVDADDTEDEPTEENDPCCA